MTQPPSYMTNAASYDFIIHQDEAAQAIMPAGNAPGTLSAVFNNNALNGTPFTAGTVTFANGQATLQLSAAEVNQIKDATYQVLAGTTVIAQGKITYVPTPAPPLQQQIDADVAPVALSGSYNDLTNKPNLATVATSGNYTDLVGTPRVHQARLATAFPIGTYSGTQTIDGMTPAVGDVVLLTGETASANNGLWVVQSGAWTRPADYAVGSEASGSVVAVFDGNVNPGTLFVEMGAAPKTVGTSGTTWQQFKKGGDRGFVNAWSLYYPGDIVTLTGNIRVLITQPVQASGTAFISSTNYAILSYLQVVDIRSFGAKVDATTDDTAAIQAAINYYATSGTSTRGTGGVVYFPPGTTRISATLDLPSNVHLKGAGYATSVIQLLANSNCDMIRTHKSTGGGNSNAYWSSIQDLMLDGRNIGNQQGTWVTDVTFGAPGTTAISSATYNWTVGQLIQGIGVLPGTTIATATGTSATLSQPLLTSVTQNGTAGTGQVMIGYDTTANRPWAAIYHETNPYNTTQSGDNQFDPTHLIRNVWIYSMAGDGVRIHGRSDITIEHVKVSFPQGSGFVIDFDTALSNCMVEKAVGHGLWAAGHSSNRIVNCKLYNTYAYGAFLNGGNGTGEITFTGNDIQQTNSHGLYISGYTTPVIAQGNTISQAGFSNQTGNVATGQDVAGVVLDGVTSAIVDAAVLNGCVGLKVINNTAKCDIRITRSSNVSGSTDMSANNQASLGTNRIVINGTVVNPVPSLAALTGDVSVSNPQDTQLLQYNSASGKWKNTTVAGFSQTYANVFGDGSDGAITLDGTTNPNTLLFTLSGGVYTLRRDVQASSLTVNSGVTLATSSMRVMCTGTITNNGTITNSGGNGSGTSAGGTLGNNVFQSNAGGAGNTATGSAGAQNGARQCVGTAGAGGSGSSTSGGAGGATNGGATWLFRYPQVPLVGTTINFGTSNAISGAPGGGGGGGDGTNKGGGGGAGGGFLPIFAHALVNNGIISAAGGNGGTPTLGNCGGGGGGGGGVIFIYTLSAVTGTGTTNVAGGSGGSGVGTGGAGVSGGAGSYQNFVLA